MEHMAGAERGAAQATDGDRLSTYEEVLERWALYDCSAVTNSSGDAEMRELFRRWRATRSKPATVSATVTPQSLDRAWTAFVERWNTEGADEFRLKLEQREADHANLSLSALAAQACELSWGADRNCCFVHYNEGCARSHEYRLSRPSPAAWQHFLDAAPLSPTENQVIGRYQRALSEARRGAPPRRRASLPHTPPRSPERLGGAPRGAPNYLPWPRASGQGTADVGEHDRRGYERRGQAVYDEERLDDRRALRSPPRYDERGPRYPQAAEGRRAETDPHERWAEAERQRRRDWERLERLERDLEELRRRLGVRGLERRERDRDWGAGWEQRR
ncbi:hypothetical protein F444_22667 [Phytophthora nicotianae P1976]|uniref:Uncharacterized protein n=1 Tax=Phytophthora nicotianae P1976 TaxID=1317066 RepID=A0A080YX42_PHYNI|nr:hypothetical protein F444_22667 [Phytophthora nicotianae P1976]